MYLHIGNKKSVKKRDIIGIFDLDTSTVSKVTRKYISKLQKSGRVTYLDSDIPRSFILTGDKKYSEIKLSRISSVGLNIRMSEKVYE
jgi:hypothetical protein